MFSGIFVANSSENALQKLFPLKFNYNKIFNDIRTLSII